MKLTRRQTLIAGLVLIGLTNAIALGGAAYNRSGEPDSTLILSERELRPPYVWTSHKENSGLALRLLWRLPPGEVHAYGAHYYSDNGGAPPWLDAQKMVSLGFNMERLAEDADAESRYPLRRQLPRDVLVVLEFDGPVYRDVLARAARAAKEAQARNERGEGKKTADEIMDYESRRNSRLFAVDAGLDRAALRSKYPDRTRYAIVHATVRPAWSWEVKGAAGFIDGTSAAAVNVPFKLRGTFEGVTPVSFAAPGAVEKGFDAKLAFGRRLEPWLVSAANK